MNYLIIGLGIMIASAVVGVLSTAGELSYTLSAVTYAVGMCIVCADIAIKVRSL